MASARTDFQAWFEKSQAGATPSARPSSSFPSMFGSQDVESGASASSSTAASPGLLSSLGAKVGLSSGQQQQQEYTCGLSTGQRYQAFAILMCGSCTLYAMALFVFLPMLLFAPAKFASAFTFASLMWLAGLGCIRGPRTVCASMLSNNNVPVTLAYVGSMAVTLYATLISQSYLLVMAAVVVQVGAAVWYSASFIPGGSSGVRAMFGWMFSPLGRMLWPFGR